MKIIFADRAWPDFTYWLSHDRKITKRIVHLVNDIEREPYSKHNTIENHPIPSNYGMAVKGKDSCRTF